MHFITCKFLTCILENQAKVLKSITETKGACTFCYVCVLRARRYLFTDLGVTLVLYQFQHFLQSLCVFLFLFQFCF